MGITMGRVTQPRVGPDPGPKNHMALIPVQTWAFVAELGLGTPLICSYNLQEPTIVRC